MISMVFYSAFKNSVAVIFSPLFFWERERERERASSIENSHGDLRMIRSFDRCRLRCL